MTRKKIKGIRMEEEGKGRKKKAGEEEEMADTWMERCEMGIREETKYERRKGRDMMNMDMKEEG